MQFDEVGRVTFPSEEKRHLFIEYATYFMDERTYWPEGGTVYVFSKMPVQRVIDKAKELGGEIDENVGGSTAA